MTEAREKIIVGSRKSQLALVQTEWVIKTLQAKYPNITFELKTLDTVGDRVLNVALSKIGDKGLFTKELEDMMLSGEIDIAVHSLKDIPTKFPEGLTLGAITEREDCLDAFISNNSKYGKCKLADLPHGAVVGSSSLRRVSQLKKAYPHLTFKDIRGNLNTRFAKLEQLPPTQQQQEHEQQQQQGDKPATIYYDGMILAVAGLKRLGWQDRICEIIQPDVSMYAVGQGALGIECRSNDGFILNLLNQSLNHYETWAMCCAERSMLAELEGGCHVPIGVFTKITTTTNEEPILSIDGIVLNLDGTKSIKFSNSGPLSQYNEIGKQLAIKLKDNGATTILEENSKESTKK